MTGSVRAFCRNARKGDRDGRYEECRRVANPDKTGDGRGVSETKKNRMSFINSCGPAHSNWCTRSGELGNINQVQKGAIFLVSVSFIEHYSTAKPCSAKTWEWGKNGPFSPFRGEKMGKGLLRWNNGASKKEPCEETARSSSVNVPSGSELVNATGSSNHPTHLI